MSHDEYITILDIEFKHATPNAVLVSKNGEEEWIPRTLLSYTCDRELDGFTRGMMIGLRIFEWKATQLGWI